MNSTTLPAGYTLLALISAGPVARVALARSPEGREVVVKQAAIDRAAASIAHEARVLEGLERAGVSGVPRVLARWDGGIALERLLMKTLDEQADAIRRDADFRARTARAGFARLEAVHRAGVVHGDVSPGNAYVAADGAEACLADFGLARVLADDADESGTFRGTLLYSAPEVARGEPATTAADVFALAASLLHVATGVPLRDPGAEPASVLVAAGTQQLDATHPWPLAARTLFPPALADTLLRCLAFDPDGRPREPSRAW
jgi:serine/threonine protein kinase